MKKVIKNNYKLLVGILIGLVISVSSVYAVEAYIESNKVSYDNHSEKITKKDNVQESIDELYERSGIHKEKWIDKELNGADPVLKDPLIPVEIKPNGEVYYANLNSEWYNYSEKRWANAVILTDTAGEYSVGDHILEKDIESYFVWIPRYQYKIWDLGQYSEAYTFNRLTDDQSNRENDTTLWKLAGSNSKLIDIKFGNIENTPKMNESEAKLNEYYTHPAFTLGNKDLNGIWVGKFETGYKGANSKQNAQLNREEPTSIIIKPDVYSWRNISIKNMFMNSYNYKRILDSHMLKNTEWGAIAYLSHSAYGIGNEVNTNNSADFKTGYSTTSNIDQRIYPGIAVESTDMINIQPWNTAFGYLASTSGNISGIYDMSGGAWEYMAACVKGQVGSSDFNINELEKQITDGYIDEYLADSSRESYNKRILGDATGELGPFYSYLESSGWSGLHSSWYADNSNFIDSSNPWPFRGGINSDGVLTGQFYFSSWTGSEYEYYSFRIALAVQ